MKVTEISKVLGAKWSAVSLSRRGLPKGNYLTCSFNDVQLSAEEKAVWQQKAKAGIERCALNKRSHCPFLESQSSAPQGGTIFFPTSFPNSAAHGPAQRRQRRGGGRSTAQVGVRALVGGGAPPTPGRAAEAEGSVQFHSSAPLLVSWIN